MEAATVIHSFGYDCNKFFNLCVMDEQTLLYCSGNFIHMLDTRTGDICLRRSEGSCGLGHAVKNPKHPHLAVGEKGDNPPIRIYEWPSFNIVSILNGGTLHSFVHLSYSPDGKMLCSQGGSPDYLLTLWDWSRCHIIVRTVSYETYNVEFSRYKSDHLTSCGVGHIKLWQISTTYTGLKLRSVLGKFGTTEVCNVVSLYSMPDLKVLSGCAWGNVLVWENGAILLEICQQGGKPCHNAPVSQIEYNQKYNEFITIGMDGWIKQWSYKAIELYDPMEDNGKIVMKPFFELLVQDVQGPAKLLSMIKKSCDPNNFIWFAQDGNGGLWEIDIEVSVTAAPPKRLYSCHSAAVTAMVSSPVGYFIATLSQSGVFHIYNTESKKLMAYANFKCSGTALSWPPFVRGCNITVAGFDDGTLRVCVLNISQVFADNNIKVIQVIKPHKAAVTAITFYNCKHQLICGSKDYTCFIFNIHSNGLLEPVGYIQLADQVVNFCWNKNESDQLLIVCKAEIYNTSLTSSRQAATMSYQLNIPMKSIKIHSEMDRGVVFAQYITKGIIWLSLDEDLFEYDLDTGVCLKRLVSGKQPYSFTSTHLGQFMILSFKDGSIRIVKTNCDKILELSEYWELSVHDIDNGIIPCLCWSYDARYIYSCGYDGNVFIYSFNFMPEENKVTVDSLTDLYFQKMGDEVNECNKVPVKSLEEEKMDSQKLKEIEVVKQHKTEVQMNIKELKERFNHLVFRNSVLPISQKLPHSDFKLDDRIKTKIQDIIKDEMDLVRRKMSFDLEKSQLRLQKLKNYFIDSLAAFSVEVSAVRDGTKVTTFTHRALGDLFEMYEKETKDEVEKVVARQSSEKLEVSMKTLDDTLTGTIETTEPVMRRTSSEPFFHSTVDIYHKLNINTRKALEKYKISKKKKEERLMQWESFMKTRPNREENLPSDILAIEKAQKTIGAYKLKTSTCYKVTDVFSLSLLYKFNQLLTIKREIFTMKENFNSKVFALRNDKVELVKTWKQLKHELDALQRILPPELIKSRPPDPQLNLAAEFPERKFQINPGKEPGTELHLTEIRDEEYDVLFSDNDETPEEAQLKCMRVTRTLFEQDQILSKMTKVVEHFNKCVKNLCREKLNVSIDIKYLEIFLFVVHQELVIIRNYSKTEQNIAEKVESSLAEKHTKLLKINILQHKLVDKLQEIREWELQIQEIDVKFKELVAGCEAGHYLTKLFKKKYKIPLFNSDSETEISESSSSDDTSECSAEEVIKKQLRHSIVSAQDDKDKLLYNQTIELRRQRHILEAEIAKLKKVVDQLKMDQNNHRKTLKLIEPVLRINQEQFETIQKDKHKQCNEMEIVVLLNCSQLQSFNNIRGLEPINRTLLMFTSTLQGLRNRVTQLVKETEVESTKIKKNQKYQTRMNEECKSMENKVTVLKQEIKKSLIRKFGQELDIDKLEEAVLKNIINKVRFDLQEEKLKKDYEEKISRLKELIFFKLEDLAELKRENTEKLQVLNTLEEEKEFVTKVLQKTETQKEKLNSCNTEEEYNKDIKKLNCVLQNLFLHRETLIEEIKVLNLKGRPLPPIPDIPRKSIPSVSLGKEHKSNT